jgi:polyphenol oxidase
VAGDEVRVPTRTGTARVRCSTRADGDLNADHVPGHDLGARWSALASGRPVTWLHEVHGTDVVVVDAPGARRGARADGAVTAHPDAALGIWVGDCAPVALVADGSDGHAVIGAFHAGWRGLAAGVLDEAVAAMRRLGASDVTAVIGPCVHAECYEFGADDLDRLAAGFGPSVRGETSWGTPALDVPAALAVACERAGVAVAGHGAACTACAADRYWSHRARGDRERHGMVVWWEPA